MISTLYATSGLELGEEFLEVAAFRLPGFLQALADTFVCVGAGGDIEKALVGLGVLDDCGGLALHGEDHGTLALSQVLHEIPGAPPERGKRLDVLIMSDDKGKQGQQKEQGKGGKPQGDQPQQHEVVGASQHEQGKAGQQEKGKSGQQQQGKPGQGGEQEQGKGGQEQGKGGQQEQLKEGQQERGKSGEQERKAG